MLSFAVAQLGARMHYAVPRILARAGMLERLYTDLYAGPKLQWLLKVVPTRLTSVARILTREAVGLPPTCVTSFPAFGIEYALRLRMARYSAAGSAAAFLWAGARFCELVRAKGFSNATAVYTYNDAALEILLTARERGLFAVLEQTIAPLAIETSLLDAERSKFPGWESDPAGGAVLERRCTRQREEWEAADLIVCGSEFVANGIRQEGGPADRCRVVPYGIDSVSTSGHSRSLMEGAAARPRNAHFPLRVLTVGAVGLRKGTPYVWRAARQMRGSAEFRMVGPVQLTGKARSEVGRDIDLLGPVPRNAVQAHYDWADVFLLPSICEGSATVTYEALAAGLPVICTPNTGSVVKDGVDGFVVPAGDYLALVERLTSFVSPGRLETMSAAALESSHDCTLEAYGRRALAAFAPGTVLV